MSEGTKFTIDRKLFHSDIWDSSPWKFKLWIYLIGKANWDRGNIKGVEVERGQVWTSYRHLRKSIGYKIGYRMKYPGINTVRRICEELTKELRIDVRTEHTGVLITLLNYNELQQFPKPRTEHRTEQERNTNGTGAEHNKEEVKNKRSKPLRVSTNGTYPDLYEGLWTSYGKRGSKKVAFKRFELHVNIDDIELFKKAIKAYLTMCAKENRTVRDMERFIFRDGEAYWMNFTGDTEGEEHPFKKMHK